MIKVKKVNCGESIV